jgi:hypothetical protein
MNVVQPLLRGAFVVLHLAARHSLARSLRGNTYLLCDPVRVRFAPLPTVLTSLLGIRDVPSPPGLSRFLRVGLPPPTIMLPALCTMSSSPPCALIPVRLCAWPPVLAAIGRLAAAI